MQHENNKKFSFEKLNEWIEQQKADNREIKIRTEVERNLRRENTDSENTVPDRLTTTVERTRLIEIHKYLVDRKYIVVDINSWLYWFSKHTWIDNKKSPSKIKWIGAAYHLPNVIYLICGNMEKSTEEAMKNAFTLPSGKSFQKLTAKNIKGAFYKDIENMLKWAERYAIK